MHTPTLSISSRFCGPSRSGNGGYVCGQIAKRLSGPASVRLFIPPPLERELRFEVADDTVKLFHSSVLLGQGQKIQLDIKHPTAPTFEEALEASQAYSGFTYHRFPRCFVCGPTRDPGDGMRIFPGQLKGQSIVAAPWQPDTSLANGSHIADEYIWAALDCPGAFAVLPVPDGKTLVLGELSVRIDSAIKPDEQCVIIGWPINIDGRKRFAGSALFNEDRELAAIASATWIEVPENTFPPEN